MTMTDWDQAKEDMAKEAAELAAAEQKDLDAIAASHQAHDLEIKEMAARLWDRRRRAKFLKALEAGDEGDTPFITFSADEVRDKPVLPDMVDGVIAYQGSLNMTSGYRGSMKSLGALSLAGAIATNARTIWGLAVNLHGPVLFVYREGQQGLARRLVAWETYHRKPMTGVTFIHEPLDMREPDDVRRLAVLARKIGAVLVILDPVARTGGGKEDAEDFGAYRLGLEALRDATGAAVLVNHNAGHAERGRGRGHSTLEDAMDSCVAFIRRENTAGGGVILEDTKGRDSAPLDDVILKFEPAGPQNAQLVAYSGVPILMTAEDALKVTQKALVGELADLFAMLDLRADGEVTKDQIIYATGIPPANFSRSIAQYLKAGLLVKVGKGPSTRYTRGLAAL